MFNPTRSPSFFDIENQLDKIHDLNNFFVRLFMYFIILSVSVSMLPNACCSDAARNSDWLIDNRSYVSGITVSPDGKDLTLSNGLVSRIFRTSPNLATGPRLYDTDSTKAVVKQWVDFYKKYRPILDSDIIHLRRPDGQDWDGFLHVNPSLTHKGFLMVYNPLATPVEKEIRVPLYYTGITEKARVKEQDHASQTVRMERDYSIPFKIRIPAKGYNWYVIEEDCNISAEFSEPSCPCFN
jgi:hypothetical protein